MTFSIHYFENVLLYEGCNDEEDCPHEVYNLLEKVVKESNNDKAGGESCKEGTYLRSVVPRYKKVKRMFNPAPP